MELHRFPSEWMDLPRRERLSIFHFIDKKLEADEKLRRKMNNR